MHICQINEGSGHLVVKIELAVNRVYELGKIKITSRWDAASKQLLREINKIGKLVQIDAGHTSIGRYWDTLQIFYFYFLKEKNVDT